MITLPSEVVLQPDDIVLTEVGSSLNLDEDEGNFSYVFNAMSDASRYIYRFALGKNDFFTVERDPGATSDCHPVFRALRVLLIAQAFAR